MMDWLASSARSVDGVQFVFQFLVGGEIALERASPGQFVACVDVFDQPLGVVNSGRQ